MKVNTFLSLGIFASLFLIGCTSSDDNNGVIDDQQVLPDMAAPQTVRLGKRSTVEIDIPANALPSRQPLTVNVRTDVVRKGAIPVGQSVEFSPGGLTFTSPVRVRQALPAPSPMRRYAAFASSTTTDVWVRRGRGRKLGPGAGPQTEVWEVEADTTGLWAFVEEADEVTVVDAGVPADAEAPVDVMPLPAPAALVTDAPAINFGDVVLGSQSPSQTIVVTNTGAMNTGAISVSLTADVSGTFAVKAGSTCQGADLAGAQTCAIQVFALPGQGVPIGGTMLIMSSSGAQAMVTLTVKGVKPPLLGASTANLSFLPAPINATGESKLVTITNTGDLPTGPIAIELKGTDATSFSVTANTCTGALMAGKTCMATITFTPAKVGNAVASLVASGSPGGAAVTNLGGTGQASDQGARLVFTNPAAGGNQVNFNESATNTCSDPIVFTVTNQGAYISEAITFAFTGADADDFVVLPTGDGCSGKRLPAASSCMTTFNICANNFGLHYATVTVSAKAAAASSSLDLYGYSY